MTRQRKHARQEEEPRATPPLPLQHRHRGSLIVLAEVPVLDSPEWSSDDELDNPTYNKRFRHKKREAIRQRLHKKMEEKERHQLEHASGAHRRGSHGTPANESAPAPSATGDGPPPPPLSTSSSKPHAAHTAPADGSLTRASKRDKRTAAATAGTAKAVADAAPRRPTSDQPPPPATAPCVAMTCKAAPTPPSMSQRQRSRNAGTRDPPASKAAAVAHNAQHPAAPAPAAAPPAPTASRRPPPLSAPQLQTPAVPAFSAVEVQLPESRGPPPRAVVRQSADRLATVPVAPLPVFGASAAAATGAGDEGAGSPTLSSMPTVSQTASPLADPSPGRVHATPSPSAARLVKASVVSNHKPAWGGGTDRTLTEKSPRGEGGSGEAVAAERAVDADTTAAAHAAAPSSVSGGGRSSRAPDSAPASEKVEAVEMAARGCREEPAVASSCTGSVRGGSNGAVASDAAHRGHPSRGTSAAWQTQQSPATPPTAAKTSTAATLARPAATTTARKAGTLDHSAGSGSSGTSPVPGVQLFLHRSASGAQLESAAGSFFDYAVFGSLTAAVLSMRPKGRTAAPAPSSSAQLLAAIPSFAVARPAPVLESPVAATLRRPSASLSRSSSSSTSATVSGSNEGTSSGQTKRRSGRVDGGRAPRDRLASDESRLSSGTAQHTWLESSVATTLSNSSRFGADFLLAYHSSYYGDMLRHVDGAAAAALSPSEPSGDSLDATRLFDAALDSSVEVEERETRKSWRTRGGKSRGRRSDSAVADAGGAPGLHFAALTDRLQSATPQLVTGRCEAAASNGAALERSPVLQLVASTSTRGRHRRPPVVVREVDRSRSATDTLSSITDDRSSPRSPRDGGSDVSRRPNRDALARRRRRSRREGSGYEGDEASSLPERRSLSEGDHVYSWYYPIGSGKDFAPAPSASPGPETAGTATRGATMTTVSTASSLRQAQSDGDDYSIGVGAVTSATTAASSVASDGDAGGQAIGAAALAEAPTTRAASALPSARATASGLASAPGTMSYSRGRTATSPTSLSAGGHREMEEEEDGEDDVSGEWYLTAASTHVSSRFPAATSRDGVSSAASLVTLSTGGHHGRGTPSPSASPPPPYDMSLFQHDSRRHAPATVRAPGAPSGGPPPAAAPAIAAATSSSSQSPHREPPPPLSPFRRPPSAPPQDRAHGSGIGSGGGGGNGCLPLTVPFSSLPRSSTRLSKSSELRSPMNRKTTATPETLLLTSVTSNGSATAPPAMTSNPFAPSLAYQPPGHLQTQAPPPPPPRPQVSASSSHSSPPPPPPPAPPKTVRLRSLAGTSVTGVSALETHERVFAAGIDATASTRPRSPFGFSSTRHTGLQRHSQTSASSDVLSFLEKACAEDDARENCARRRRRKERGRRASASDHSGDGNGIVELLSTSSTTAGGAMMAVVPSAPPPVPVSASASSADAATLASTTTTTATATRSSQSNSSSGPGASAALGRTARPESSHLSARSSMVSSEVYYPSAAPPPPPPPPLFSAAAASQQAVHVPRAEEGTTGSRAPPAMLETGSEVHIVVPTAAGARGTNSRAVTGAITSSGGSSTITAVAEVAHAQPVLESAHLTEIYTSSRGLPRDRHPTATRDHDLDSCDDPSCDDSARTIVVDFAARAPQSFFVAPAAPSFIRSAAARPALAAPSLPRATVDLLTSFMGARHEHGAASQSAHPVEAAPSAPPPPPPQTLQRRRNTAPCSPPGTRVALPSAASSLSTLSSSGPTRLRVRRTIVASRLRPRVGDRAIADDGSAGLESASAVPVHVAGSRLDHAFTTMSSVDSSRNGGTVHCAPFASADCDPAMGGSGIWGSVDGSVLVPPPRPGQSVLAIATAPLALSPSPSPQLPRRGGAGGTVTAMGGWQLQPSRQPPHAAVRTADAGADESTPDSGTLTLALHTSGLTSPVLGGNGGVQRSSDDFSVFTDRRNGSRVGASAAGAATRGGGALPLTSAQRPPSASSSLAVWSTVGLAAERVSALSGHDYNRSHADFSSSGGAGGGGDAAEDLVRMLSARMGAAAPRANTAAARRLAPPRALSPLPDALLLDGCSTRDNGSSCTPAAATARTGVPAASSLWTSAARPTRERIMSTGSCDGEDGSHGSRRLNEAPPIVARLTAEALRRQQERQRQAEARLAVETATATRGATEDLLTGITVLRDEPRWEAGGPGASLTSLLNASVFAPRAGAASAGNGRAVAPRKSGGVESPPGLQRSVEGQDNGDAHAYDRPSGALPSSRSLHPQ